MEALCLAARRRQPAVATQARRALIGAPDCPAAGCNMPTWSDDSGQGRLKAPAAPANPGAPPEHLAGLPWPQGPAPGRPKLEFCSPSTPGPAARDTALRRRRRRRATSLAAARRRGRRGAARAARGAQRPRAAAAGVAVAVGVAGRGAEPAARVDRGAGLLTRGVPRSLRGRMRVNETIKSCHVERAWAPVMQLGSIMKRHLRCC